MDLADLLNDLPNQAVEDIWGKAISYVHPGGAIYAFDADYQAAFNAANLGGQVPYDTTVEALDARKTALDALDLRPLAGARVTFTVHEEIREYRITTVHYTAAGSVVMVLGERTIPLLEQGV